MVVIAISAVAAGAATVTVLAVGVGAYLARGRGARQSLGEGRPLLGVVLEHVSGEVAALPERHAADGALVRLLPRVDSAGTHDAIHCASP